jgi:hypothetical protein
VLPSQNAQMVVNSKLIKNLFKSSERPFEPCDIYILQLKIIIFSSISDLLSRIIKIANTAQGKNH